jgi:hypothetical protein
MGCVTVKSPVRHRRNGHTVLERLATVHLDGLERREAAVAPAPNSNPLCVDVLLLCPDLGCSDLIVAFVVADVASSDAP